MIAVAALAQTASEKPSIDVRRVGARLACRCGCTDSIATCSMLECHSSKPAKEKIAKMQAEGKFDKAKGSAHNLAGDVKDAARDASKTK